MSDTPKTPEELRVEALTERRRRRRATAKRWAWRSSLAAGVLTLLIAFAIYWLISTVAGRDVLLAQIVARLPADSTFTWKSAEGPVAGPLTLRDVRFAYKDTLFTAERIYLEPALRPLLGRKLRVDALQVTTVPRGPGRNPEGRGPFRVWRCCSALAWNHQAAGLAPSPARKWLAPRPCGVNQRFPWPPSPKKLRAGAPSPSSRIRTRARPR